jgi:hypothetical protein
MALGVAWEGGLEIQGATLCIRERAAASVIASWVRESQDPVLIAIDAHWVGRSPEYCGRFKSLKPFNHCALSSSRM